MKHRVEFPERVSERVAVLQQPRSWKRLMRRFLRQPVMREFFMRRPWRRVLGGLLSLLYTRNRLVFSSNGVVLTSDRYCWIRESEPDLNRRWQWWVELPNSRSAVFVGYSRPSVIGSFLRCIYKHGDDYFDGHSCQYHRGAQHA